jgi:hypothetical protein
MNKERPNLKIKLETNNITKPKMSNIKKSDGKDDKFETAYKKFLEKKNVFSSQNEEKKLLKSINTKLPNYKDESFDKLDFIEENVYKEELLSNYYKYSKENNFNVQDLIITWINNLYELVHVKYTNNPLMNEEETNE